MTSVLIMHRIVVQSITSDSCVKLCRKAPAKDTTGGQQKSRHDDDCPLDQLQCHDEMLNPSSSPGERESLNGVLTASRAGCLTYLL